MAAPQTAASALTKLNDRRWELLSELQDLAGRLEPENLESVHWGHVGTAGLANDCLAEAVQALRQIVPREAGIK